MSAFKNGDDTLDALGYLFVYPALGVASTAMPSVCDSTSPSNYRTGDMLRGSQLFHYEMPLAWVARAEERICPYCDTVFHPSKFHPGSCQECGAPIGRKT